MAYSRFYKGEGGRTPHNLTFSKHVLNSKHVFKFSNMFSILDFKTKITCSLFFHDHSNECCLLICSPLVMSQFFQHPDKVMVI